MSSANGNCQESTKSSNGSKRNIANRKYMPAIGLNQTKLVTAVNVSNNQSVNIPPKGNKEFIIKNKVKREYTN